MKNPIKTERAWAWECEFGLYQWAEPSKDELLSGGKPTQEARPVAVRLIKEIDYRRLLKQLRGGNDKALARKDRKP